LQRLSAKLHIDAHPKLIANSPKWENLITIAGSPDELEKIASRRHGPHAQNKQKELNELRALIARDLEDAAIQELSDDRRLATACRRQLGQAGQNRCLPSAARLAREERVLRFRTTCFISRSLTYSPGTGKRQQRRALSEQRASQTTALAQCPVE
jgi:hypothetical protein